MSDFRVFQHASGTWFAIRDEQPKFSFAGETEQEVRDEAARALAFYASLDTPAPITTPEEVAAALNVLSRASGLGYTVHAALDIVLPALSTLKADNERLTRERERFRAESHLHAGEAVKLLEQVASLTETVGKLREELAIVRDLPVIATAEREDAGPLGTLRWLKGRARAALTPTEPAPVVDERPNHGLDY